MTHACVCISGLKRTLSYSLSKGKCQLHCLLNDAAGRPRSGRDMPRWQLHRRSQTTQLSRMGAQQVAAPDEPSRLPEGAAQPASSHHVPGMRALRVGQRYTSCATRDPDGELPASCRRQTPSALRGAWNSTNGTSGEPHECRDHAETFTLTYQSISLTHRPVYYTFVGHAGDTTSTSPIQSFAGVDQQ